jgi:hypothetical protein
VGQIQFWLTQPDVLTGYRRLLGDDHPDTLTAQGNVAITLKALRERDQTGSTASKAGP